MKRSDCIPNRAIYNQICNWTRTMWWVFIWRTLLSNSRIKSYLRSIFNRSLLLVSPLPPIWFLSSFTTVTLATSYKTWSVVIFFNKFVSLHFLNWGKCYYRIHSLKMMRFYLLVILHLFLYIYIFFFPIREFPDNRLPDDKYIPPII